MDTHTDMGKDTGIPMDMVKEICTAIVIAIVEEEAAAGVEEEQVTVRLGIMGIS